MLPLRERKRVLFYHKSFYVEHCKPVKTLPKSCVNWQIDLTQSLLKKFRTNESENEFGKKNISYREKHLLLLSFWLFRSVHCVISDMSELQKIHITIFSILLCLEKQTCFFIFLHFSRMDFRRFVLCVWVSMYVCVSLCVSCWSFSFFLHLLLFLKYGRRDNTHILKHNIELENKNKKIVAKYHLKKCCVLYFFHGKTCITMKTRRGIEYRRGSSREKYIYLSTVYTFTSIRLPVALGVVVVRINGV